MFELGPTTRASTVQRIALRIALAWGCFVASVGCEVTASVGRDQPESAGGGEGGVLTSGAMTGTASVGETDDTDGGGGGGGSGGGVTGRPAEETGGSGSDPTGHQTPPLCQAHDGMTACAACRKGHCCEQILGCHDAPGCFCFWDCIIHDGASDIGCRETCDYDGPEWEALVLCQHEMCLKPCGDQGPTDVPPMPMD